MYVVCMTVLGHGSKFVERRNLTRKLWRSNGGATKELAGAGDDDDSDSGTGGAVASSDHVAVGAAAR